jgi:hypothetical protein
VNIPTDIARNQKTMRVSARDSLGDKKGGSIEYLRNRRPKEYAAAIPTVALTVTIAGLL